MAKGVTIDFTANLAKFEAGIDKATRRLDKFSRDAKGQSSAVARSFNVLGAKIVAAFAGLSVGGSIIQVNRDFQKLKASLVSVTGSAESAEKAFDLIQKFASKTPYSVQELTSAFTKLTALGLKPSEEALTSYGNTASAMGKTLDQFVEAVADAVTGEFERLKEFGIKARSEAENVAFTFQGVTKTVGKNADEIEAYLRSIGDVQFAGSMERQTKTIDGAFSNLNDSVDRLFVKLGEGGLNKLMTKWARGATTIVEALFTDDEEKFEEQVNRRIELINDIVDLSNNLNSQDYTPELKDTFRKQLVEWRKELDEINTEHQELRDGLNNIDATNAVASINSLEKAITNTNKASKAFAETQKLFKADSGKVFDDSISNTEKISKTYRLLSEAISPKAGEDQAKNIEKAAAAINKLKESGAVADQTIKDMKASIAELINSKDKPKLEIQTTVDSSGIVTMTDKATQEAQAQLKPLIVPVQLEVSSIDSQIAAIQDGANDIQIAAQQSGGRE